MADPVFLNDCKVWFGGYDLSRAMNRVRLKGMWKENPDGRFGDGLEVAFPGVRQIEAMLGGFNAPGAGEVDEVLYPRINTDVTGWPVTMAPPSAPSAAAGADGNIAFTLVSAQYAFSLISGEHGQSLGFDLDNKPRSGGGSLYRQTVLLPKATVTATTTGTGRQLGAVLASQKLVCTLHVFAVTGGTWTATVESDNGAGFGTPIVRATFTGATGITRQVIEVVGPITDDYFRVVLTKSGGTNCTAAALVSVEPIS